MKHKKFLLSLLMPIISMNLFANSKLNNNLNQNSFIIESNATVTLDLLDRCWDNRQNEYNQQIIADFLMKKPLVPNDFEIAWKMARLVYFIGNYGIGENKFVDTKQGVSLFEYGYNAGMIAKKLEPKKVEGYYWYAIDLGSYGLAKGILSAAKNARAGMNALKEAQKINPSYQWYGSSRILGRYYQELPGLFGGDDKLALKLFKEATQKAPEYNNNWVFLGNFYNHDGQYESAINVCNKVKNIIPVDGKYENRRFIKEANQCIEYAKRKLD